MRGKKQKEPAGMPQTVESINHAKAANIPIIVAINKIDKPEANPDRVKQQLTEYGLLTEDWGGDTICCPISAKKNIGIENLLEMVTLTAEMAELKANPNRAGQGTVIEARLDKGRGPVATLLVQNGTLKQGDVIIAGTAVGRVRTMKQRVIALGFFDGVHLGHGALLRRTVEEARRRGCFSAVFTFDRPPKEVITGVPSPLINSPEDRGDLVRRLYGIDEVLMVPFDTEMRTTPWDRFITDILMSRYHAVHLVAGHDHHFGYRNQGSPELLRSKCAELGLGCDIIPKVEIGGIVVSSTYIRRLVEMGQMDRAAKFLGHPHTLSQEVLHGKRIGHTIGIPTVNLTVPPHGPLQLRGVCKGAGAGRPGGGHRPRPHPGADVRRTGGLELHPPGEGGRLHPRHRQRRHLETGGRRADSPAHRRGHEPRQTPQGLPVLRGQVRVD